MRITPTKDHQSSFAIKSSNNITADNMESMDKENVNTINSPEKNSNMNGQTYQSEYDHDDEIEFYKSEIYKLNCKVKDLSVHRDRIKDENYRLVKEMERLQDENLQLSNQKTELENYKCLLESYNEIKQMGTGNNIAIGEHCKNLTPVPQPGECINISVDNSKDINAIQDFEAKIVSLETQLTNVLQVKDELTQSVEKLSNDLQSKCELISQYETTIEIQNSSISSTENENLQLNKQIQQIEMQYKQDKKLNEQQIEQIKILNEKLINLNEQSKHIESKLKNKCDENQSLNEKIVELQQTIDNQLEGANNDSDNGDNNKDEIIESNIKDLLRLENTVSELQVKLSEVEEENVRVSSFFSQTVSDLEKVNKEKEASHSKMIDLKDELFVNKNKLQRIENQLNDKNDQIKQLCQQNESLWDQISLNKNLEVSFDKIKHENEQLKQTINEYKTQNNSLTQQLQNVQLQFKQSATSSVSNNCDKQPEAKQNENDNKNSNNNNKMCHSEEEVSLLSEKTKILRNRATIAETNYHKLKDELSLFKDQFEKCKTRCHKIEIERDRMHTTIIKIRDEYEMTINNLKRELKQYRDQKNKNGSQCCSLL